MNGRKLGKSHVGCMCIHCIGRGGKRKFLKRFMRRWDRRLQKMKVKWLGDV